MEITAQWWTHALGVGTLSALGAGTVLITVLLATPYTFLKDAPEDIREHAAEPNRTQQRAATATGLAFIIAFAVALGTPAWTWTMKHPDTSYWSLALMALTTSILFAIIDILIIDWLIICTLRPKRIVYPGTENCAGWRDYSYHVKEQLRPRGIAALAISSAIVALVVWLFT